MSLAPSFRDYQGQRLCYKPTYGWGWCRYSGTKHESADFNAIERAGTFEIRVLNFITMFGELRGIAGPIEQPNHPFDGMWASTWTMIAGDFNLTDRLCPRWDVELRTHQVDDGDEPGLRRWALVYDGYGVLAESHP